MLIRGMAREKDRDSGKTADSRNGAIALGVAILLAGGAIGYKLLNGEEEPAEASGVTAAAPSIAELRARAEARPDDPLAWQELGLAHFERGEFAEAAGAYERAVAIDGEEAVLWSTLGEARVMASERDPMPQAALEAFRKALALDPADPRARYFLAVEKDLNEDHEGAIADWLALLEDTPPGAGWERDLVRTIEQVGKIHDIDVESRIAAAIEDRDSAMGPAIGPAMDRAASGLPGPSSEQIAAAGSIPPSEQRDMALGMVERLEQRLRDDPSNLDGWVMLMRSRMTLGDPAAARAARDAAIAANPGAAQQLRAQASALGVR